VAFATFRVILHNSCIAMNESNTIARLTVAVHQIHDRLWIGI